ISLQFHRRCTISRQFYRMTRPIDLVHRRNLISIQFSLKSILSFKFNNTSFSFKLNRVSFCIQLGCLLPFHSSLLSSSSQQEESENESQNCGYAQTGAEAGGEFGVVGSGFFGRGG